MSTYASDSELDMFEGPYGIDVAACCLGDDVRLIVDRRAARLEPEEAEAIAAALMRAAESVRDVRADRITEPVSHEAATSGEEA